MCQSARLLLTPKLALLHCCTFRTSCLEILQNLPLLCLLLIGDDIASMVHVSSGEEAFRVKPMDKIWVELAASDSTAHGPTLRIRLVADQHPAVQAASQAMQAASEADYIQRAERALKQPIAQAPRAQEVGSFHS